MTTIRQLGRHAGKHVIFGYDSDAAAEAAEYMRLLSQYGIAQPVTGRELTHHLVTAQRVCERVQGNAARVGVLLGATGIGMSIAANKFAGIYAARCVTAEDAELARRDDNANVLCLAARGGVTLNARIIEAFMHTPFEGRRLEDLQYITCLELESERQACAAPHAAGDESFAGVRTA